MNFPYIYRCTTSSCSSPIHSIKSSFPLNLISSNFVANFFDDIFVIWWNYLCTIIPIYFVTVIFWWIVRSRQTIPRITFLSRTVKRNSELSVFLKSNTLIPFAVRTSAHIFPKFLELFLTS